MQNTIKERTEYLQKQVDYYKSISDFNNAAIFAAVINELSYWQTIYEPKLVFSHSQAQENSKPNYVRVGNTIKFIDDMNISRKGIVKEIKDSNYCLADLPSNGLVNFIVKIDSIISVVS